MGSAGRKTITHMCPRFTWLLQNLKFTFDLRVLDMSSFDIILGVNWIKLFDSILFYFHQSTMSFRREGKTVILHGLGALASTSKLLPFNNSEHLLHGSGIDFQSPLFCVMLQTQVFILKSYNYC